MVHAEAGHLLEEGQQQLPLPPAVQHHRDGPEVHALGRHLQQVAGDAVELCHEDPDGLGPGRDLHPQQVLGGQRERQLVEEGGEVVHTGDVGGALHVGQGLGRLLHPGVEVADDRLEAPDVLPLQLQLQAQHPVGGGVLGPHVEDLHLVRRHIVLDDVVVLDDGAPLLGQLGGGLVGQHLLGALGRRARHPVGLLGAAHPDIEVAAALLLGCGVDVAGGRHGVGGCCGVSGRQVGGVGHQVVGADLNWTGTEPTA